MIGNTILRYRIIVGLFSGGLRVSYSAKGINLKRSITLKIPPEEASKGQPSLEKPRPRAEITSILNHCHGSTKHDIDKVGGQRFITMGFLKGRILKDEFSEGCSRISPCPNHQGDCHAKDNAHDVFDGGFRNLPLD